VQKTTEHETHGTSPTNKPLPDTTASANQPNPPNPRKANEDPTVLDSVLLTSTSMAHTALTARVVQSYPQSEAWPTFPARAGPGRAGVHVQDTDGPERMRGSVSAHARRCWLCLLPTLKNRPPPAALFFFFFFPPRRKVHVLRPWQIDFPQSASHPSSTSFHPTTLPYPRFQTPLTLAQ
jgi:hypothetical protein